MRLSKLTMRLAKLMMRLVDDEVSKVDGEVSKTICTTATGTRWQEEKKRKKKIS